jgi:leucyl-tRNA synthetase
MESSWYPLRYASPTSKDWMDRAEIDYWMPVDQYIGGAEHATKHLIYARFFTKMLRDWGWVAPTLDEPFARLLTQGMVVKETYRCPNHDYLYPEDVEFGEPSLGQTPRGRGAPHEAVPREDARQSDGKCKLCGSEVTIGRTEKMSKSLKNVVEPLPLIEKYGADTVRVFSLFAAPPDSMLEWSEAGVEGGWRFLNRVWRLVVERLQDGAVPTDEVRQKMHQTIKKVTEDVGGERFHFNTAIAAIMELVNALYAAPAVDRASAEAVVRLLAPFAPHISEELWRRLGHSEMLATHPWLTFDPEIAQKKRVPFPVQVNGKLRGQVEAEPTAEQATVESAARELPTVAAALDGKQIVKIVFVKGRLINFVVK